MKIIMTYQQYLINTGYDNNPEKRGANISLVDRAFAYYEQEFPNANTQKKVALAAQLFKACKVWLAGKVDKKNTKWLVAQNENLLRRREVITMVATECLETMAVMQPDLIPLALFNTKKVTALAKGKEQPLTKTLSDYYILERQAYEARGKQSSPPSASEVREENNTRGMINADALEKIKLDKFEKLAAVLDAGLVKFMSKNQRLAVMCHINAHGLFEYASTGQTIVGEYTGPTQPPAAMVNDSSFPLGNSQIMYAMDKYGNLFASEAETRKQLAQAGFAAFNHSTFNAGKEVICAGMITIVRGKLCWINNDSGHYKPTHENLRQALLMLMSDGANMDNVVVGARNPKTKLMEAYQLATFMNKGAPDVPMGS